MKLNLKDLLEEVKIREEKKHIDQEKRIERCRNIYDSYLITIEELLYGLRGAIKLNV